MSTPVPPQSKGTLYLVPTPLDFGCPPEYQAPIQDTLPARTLAIAARLNYWVTENAKSTRAFLKRVNTVHGLAQPIQSLSLTELPREIHKKGDHTPGHKPDSAPQIWLSPALAGHDIGLISEAGMPAIADPGSSVVRNAHALGIDVEVLVGPVSLMLALASSGLNGQHFAFVGYLPQDKQARTVKLRELENQALKTGQTQIFIETPYRNEAMVQAAISALQPQTWFAVSGGLTLASSPSQPTSTTKRQHSAPIRQWKSTPPHLDMAAPMVFMIGA